MFACAGSLHSRRVPGGTSGPTFAGVSWSSLCLSFLCWPMLHVALRLNATRGQPLFSFLPWLGCLCLPFTLYFGPARFCTEDVRHECEQIRFTVQLNKYRPSDKEFFIPSLIPPTPLFTTLILVPLSLPSFPSTSIPLPLGQHVAALRRRERRA